MPPGTRLVTPALYHKLLLVVHIKIIHWDGLGTWAPSLTYVTMIHFWHLLLDMLLLLFNFQSANCKMEI